MSYSCQGNLRPEEIEDLFRSYGCADSYDRVAIPHRRYRNGTGAGAVKGGGTVTEYLHYVRLR
jgi:hypothetical protein